MIRDFLCPDGGKIKIGDCLKENGCRLHDRCATRPYLILCSKERNHLFRCVKCSHEARLPSSNKKFGYKCNACLSLMEYIPSTTQCIAGTKHAFLKLTTDYDISPDSRAFMIQGTKTHENLEQADDEYSLLEEKFIEGDVTGISDVITTEDGVTILSDYKNAGSYKIMQALGFYVDEEKTGEFFKSGKRKGEEKTRKIVKRDDTKRDVGDWAWQLNKYRIDYELKSGKKVEKLKIQAVVRDGNTHIARSRGVFRNIYYFEIPILPDSTVIEYFRTKRGNLLKALKQGFWNDVCTAHECWDGIKCASYCEVADSCPQGKYLKKERIKEGEMPIQGLSEARRLPRMGKIRLGIMKRSEKTGNEYPTEVNYFILDPAVENEIENKRLIDIFHQKYGDKPTSIPIMFPVADIEKVFPQYYKSYGKTTMLNCKGDGIEATTNNPEYISALKVLGDGEMGKRVICAGQNCPFYKSGKCTESATLSILLPELPGAGVWQITTGSYNSIVNLNSCFDYIRAIAGRFHMIPLRLERRETPIQHDGKKTNHYILHVNMEIALAELQKLAKIDPDRIAMELPAIEDDKKDLFLENNSAVNPPTEEKKDETKPQVTTSAKLAEAVTKKAPDADRSGVQDATVVQPPPVNTEAVKPIPPPVNPPREPVNTPTGKVLKSVLCEKVTTKEGDTNGKHWTKYGFLINKEWYGTFDRKFADMMNNSIANKVLMTLSYLDRVVGDKTYHEIVSLEVADIKDLQDAGELPEDEVPI